MRARPLLSPPAEVEADGVLFLGAWWGQPPRPGARPARLDRSGSELTLARLLTDTYPNSGC